MAFVMSENIDNEELTQKHFDAEPFNYIFNKSSGLIAFLEQKSSTPMGKVLHDLEHMDAKSINLLNYTGGDNQSALSYALDNDLFRNIDSILKYMAKLKIHNKKCFSKLICDLVDF